MHMNHHDITAHFAPRKVPQPVVHLWNFTVEHAARDYFSAGFEWASEDPHPMLRTHSEDPDFAAGFLVFANALASRSKANGMDSVYAFWLETPEHGLAETPVVAFGGEGGIQVVTRDFREFMCVLTLDAEPMVDHDGIDFYRDGEDAPSANIAAYRRWVSEVYGLGCPGDPESLVAQARQQLQGRLAHWIGMYV